MNACFFRYYKKAEMGRAARNHGGTGGHGYFPLAGERPNYNLHVLKDRALYSLVNNNQGKIPSKEQLVESSKKNNQHSMKAEILDVKSTSNKDNMVSFTPIVTKTTKDNSSQRKEMTSVELPRFKDEQPPKSKKPKDTKLHEEAEQTNQPHSKQTDHEATANGASYQCNQEATAAASPQLS